MNLSTIIEFLKTFSLFVSVILFFILVYIILKFIRFNKDKVQIAQTIQPSAPIASGPLDARWTEITNHINSNREGEWKFAVIEADKLADDVLKKSGFPGETMGERLMSIDKTRLLSIDGLWEAHKVRNRIAHDVSYFLRHSEARKAVALFEASLRELGVLSS